MSKLTIETAAVFAPLLAPARYKAAHGGRGSGKSHFFAGLMVEGLVLDPRRRFVCIREVQKSLRESSRLLIIDKIKEFGVADKFRVLDDRIETGGGGLIIFQGMQDHTAESVKSFEGFSAWVEEAQTMTEKSLEMLRPTIRPTPRSPSAELWFSFNPRLRSDAVDKFFRGGTPPPDSVIVEANYKDNPWFPKELESDRLHHKRERPDPTSRTPACGTWKVNAISSSTSPTKLTGGGDNETARHAFKPRTGQR